MAKVTAKVGALTAQNNKLQGKPKQQRMSDYLAMPATQAWLLNSLGDKHRSLCHQYYLRQVIMRRYRLAKSHLLSRRHC